MSFGGRDATGEGECTCQKLPGNFLEELQENFESPPEEVGTRILEAMGKEGPWKVGSWTVLREDSTGVMTHAIVDSYAAGAEVGSWYNEVLNALKRTFAAR